MKTTKMNTGMTKKTEYVVSLAVHDFEKRCEKSAVAAGRRWVPAKNSKSAGHYEFLHADGIWKIEKTTLSAVVPVCNADLDNEPRHPMTGLTFSEIDAENARLAAANAALLAALERIARIGGTTAASAIARAAIQSAKGGK